MKFFHHISDTYFWNLQLKFAYSTTTLVNLNFLGDIGKVLWEMVISFLFARILI